MWWVFFGLALGLGFSIMGATLGTGGRRRRAEAAAAALYPTAPALVAQEAHT
jgi:hypothetical protein